MVRPNDFDVPTRPRVAIIAGPNGSGKSTFYRSMLASHYAVFVNADNISRDQHLSNKQAADLASEQRETFIREGQTFAFETVFSRTAYWLDFIFKAMAAQYRVELYFLCTESPDLNIIRVETRVQAGGHAVPADKVVKRYSGAIQTALLAKELVDELRLYDNSAHGQSPSLVGHFFRRKLLEVSTSIPPWALPFFVADSRRQQ